VLRFIFRKMLNKKWMVLALLIGNILLVSITSGNPMYTQAVLQRTLTQSMQTYLTENNVYPGLAMITTGGRVKDAAVLTEYGAVAGGFSERFQLPEKDAFFYYSLNSSKALLEKERSDYTQQYVSIDAKQALPEHSTMVAGRMYTDTIGENNLIEAVVSRRALIQLGLMVDDVLVFPNLTAPDGNPVRVQIVGVFTNESDEDLYWTQAPSRYTNNFFVNEQVFEAFFLQPDAEGRLKYAVMSTWYSMLDYTAMRAEDAQTLLATAEAYDDELNDLTTKVYNDCFSDILREYLKTAQKVTVTLWVLQAPIFALLAAFIFMVSRQMMDMEQSEIAVVKSRGAGKAQIFTIYLIQSLILALAAFVCGLPLGYLLCQVIGSANAFLEFVSRSALPVKVTRDAILFAGGAAALSVLAMLLPAMQHSRASIVHAKRKKQRKSALPIWQKFGFDFILLGVSLYGLYSFSGQKDAIAARVLEGGSVDPLLFLSSSLFMIGAGLLAAIVVLAVMILPSIIKMSVTALDAVPKEYEDASLALGATPVETYFKVSVPAAKSGIAAAVVLGVGRAIGEAMAVMMVAGNAANMPDSLFQSVRFLTTAVAGEMAYSGGLQRQALFSIALVLFLFIMLINAALNFFLKREKE